MAYRIEGKDIVIDGFEQGIADSPYKGLADMRNMDIVSVPTEAAVALANTPITNIPPVYTNTAFTASASTDRLTVASVAGLYEGVAIALTPTNFTLDVFVLGGGGGGGNGPGGGGGGGGEYLLTEDHVVSIGSYPVTVGGGGATATNGSSSIFNTLTAIGGGAGGTGSSNGANGGSGGGGGGDPVGGAGSTTSGGSALAAHGEDGGDGTKDPPYYLGGGGGGSAAVGADATSTQGGAGGNSSSNSISGASVAYGGGGGGGGDRDGALAKPTVAAGGTGGGGAGASASEIDFTAAVPGTANRGGGGGGGVVAGAWSPEEGAAGGSGVVIISYPTGSINATGGTITTSGGNTIHTFNSSGTFTVSAIGASTLYYVRNIVGTTFQISVAPTGAIYDFTFDTTGTFTTYQYGNQRGINAQAPISYFVDKVSYLTTNSNAVFLVDGSNYGWFISSTAIGSIPANSLVFLGNVGGIGASSTPGSGLVIWKDYLLLFGAGTANMNVLDMSTFMDDGPVVSWEYSFVITQTNTINGRVSVLVSQEDDNVYFSSGAGVGSLIENPGEVFDPSDIDTYTFTNTAIQVSRNDESTCLAELGPNLIIGGRRSFVYVWDKVSPGFTGILNIPDNFTTAIVPANQNAYIFTGTRGYIYITNGSGIDVYKKYSDYLTGVTNPYIRWKDANFIKNQLVFGITATTNAAVAVTTVAGVWAIDLNTDALRMLNKLTNSGYGATTATICEYPVSTSTNNSNMTAGNSLLVGWFTGSTYGLDIGTSNPYTNYESYLQTEFIPVGTFLDPFTPSQIEWKTALPLVSGEGVKLSYRTSLADTFTLISETTTAGQLSDMYKTNFQKAQWVQLLLETKSTASSPSFVRATEIRIRDYPSGKLS